MFHLSLILGSLIIESFIYIFSLCFWRHLIMKVHLVILRKICFKTFSLLASLFLQAMRFGDLPCWAIELSYNIRDNVQFRGCVPEFTDPITVDKNEKACPFPLEILWREPLFNQLIVNIYQPGEVSLASCMLYSCLYSRIPSFNIKVLSFHLQLLLVR